MWKMSIQYTVPGIKPTTLGTEHTPVTTKHCLITPKFVYDINFWVKIMQ